MKLFGKKIFILYLFLSLDVICQTSVDSLMKLASFTQGRDKVSLLNQIGSLYINENVEKCIEVSEEALRLSADYKDNINKNIALKNLMQANLTRDNYRSAMKYANLLLESCKSSHESEGQVYANNKIGYYYLYLSEFDMSIKTLLESREMADKLNFKKEYAVAENYLGIAYYILHQPEKAEEHCRRALKIFLDLNDQNGIADSKEHLGIIMLANKKYTESLELFLDVLKIRISQNNQYRIVGTQSNIGLIYIHLEELDKANEIYQSNLKIYQKLNIPKGIAISYARIGSILRDKGDFKESLNYYLKSYELAKIHDTRRGVINTLNNIKTIYAEKFYDYKNAYYYLTLMSDLKDSVNKVENQEKIAEVNKKFERDQSLREQKNLIYFLIGILLIIIIFSLIIFKEYRDKRKINKVLIEKNRYISSQQQELQKVNSILSDTNATKSKLFSIISHDLRGNIGILKSTLEVLVDEKNLVEQSVFNNFLHLLKSNATATYELLENLLSWSLTEQGLLKFDPGKYSVSEIVDEMLNLFKGNIENKLIILSVDINKSLTGYFDKTMIMTVARNLMSNAIKFSKMNGEVSITASQEDGFIRVSIKDSGIGIEENELKNVFDIKTKKVKPGTEAETGIGLGLTICKEFVSINGGELFTESVEGKGSVFSFTVPEG